MKTRLIDVIGITFLIIAILITVFDVIGLNRSFYDRQYQVLNTAENMEMSHSDLMAATDTLFDYIKDKRDDIHVLVNVKGETVEMFNQRETDHMVDVKDLYRGVMLFRTLSFVGFLIIAVISLRHASRFQLSQTIYKSLWVFFFVIGSIALYAVIDFSGFWIVFHKVLFSNDLWLLNPKTDRMINMFPEVFFNRLVLRVLIGFASVFIVRLMIGKVLEKSES